MTGRPAPAAVVDWLTVAKLRGWLKLLRWFALSHHENFPVRSPSVALACCAGSFWSVPYLLNCWMAPVTSRLPSNVFGMRVVISVTAP